jgi:hypothetical protein
MRWVGYVAYTNKKKNACKVLVENLEGKKLLGRSRGRWEDNIQVNLKGKGLDACTGYILFRIGISGGLL